MLGSCEEIPVCINSQVAKLGESQGHVVASFFSFLGSYYDYQLSKAQGKFGDKVLMLKPCL